MNLDSSAFSRRDVLKTTLLFSSGLLAGGWASRLQAATAKTDFGQGGLHLLAVGDYGTANAEQKKVADCMNSFAGKLRSPLSAVLALGDNFYGMMTPERFQPGFEQMYSKEHLDCPFYALLGNHDYGPQYDSKQGRAKADMQLDYAKANPTSRWKMPAKWYSFELGAPDKPLVKVIYLDGNNFEGALTPQEKIDQKRWLEAEMQKKTSAKWLWVVSHYPLFSDTTKRGDKEGAKLVENWGAYLREKPVSLYLSGHDHNLQHLRVEGYQPSFLVSGGGGAHRYEVQQSDRGFSMQTRGFNHIHVTEDKLTVQLINPDGQRLHAFERNLKGETTILTV
ncbi:metallophosphoesterase [Luteolibacter ambystomatis]|uniref:Metallophosphoesterase n=1 Tax=Luteolibacter ambystomatis TaxID=2824561 RepID=A0A975IXM1_9BACT|nr:metallophosphoesterase [Luteolibacter ambystomatis]QUE49471.1 metallophosphoesterase [Luteolibacter ambystomatis]